jgi:hypothetical protein
MHNGSFVEMCELSHVIGLIKFRRVDSINALGINLLLLQTEYKQNQYYNKTDWNSYCPILQLDQ